MSEFDILEKALEEDEDISVSLILDDETQIDCSVVAIFAIQKKEYIALLPFNEEHPEVFLYRLKKNDEDEIKLENIVDDEEFDLVAEAYDSLVDDET